jgi:hypothetical protein
MPADGTFFDGYGIRSAKPCRVTMQSSVFTPWLQIQDGAGTAIAQGAGTGNPSTISLDLNACSSAGGTILILANSLPTVTTGAYTLTLTITGGGSIVAPGPVAHPATGPIDVLNAFGPDPAAKQVFLRNRN